MPPLSLLIKPASSNCNLRCRYCFYHSVAESRNTRSYGIMTIDTLETIVKKALEYAEHTCTFAFQGGEPTLAGLEFFEKLIEFEKKYNIKKLKINNALQTNGIVIDELWAEYLYKNNFLVGLSLDGPKDINDENRIDVNSKGTFMRVMKAVDLFDKYKVQYNILSVINGQNAKQGNRIYKFYKKYNFKYIQFIPCLDPLGEVPGNNPYSLTAEKFTIFLKNMFDQWYSDIVMGEMVSIRYFDNLVGMLMGYRPEACDMLGYCSCQFVIEADGGAYPCDFYVTDEWSIGNIKDLEFDKMKNSDICKRFIEASKYLTPQCMECKWFKLCRGGCRRNREPFIEGRPTLNYLCPSYKEFLDYAGDRIYRIASMLSRK